MTVGVYPVEAHLNCPTSSTISYKCWTKLKVLPGSNTLAYVAVAMGTKDKGLITSTPVVHVIKFFIFITDKDAK